MCNQVHQHPCNSLACTLHRSTVACVYKTQNHTGSFRRVALSLSPAAHALWVACIDTVTLSGRKHNCVLHECCWGELFLQYNITLPTHIVRICGVRRHGKIHTVARDICHDNSRTVLGAVARRFTRLDTRVVAVHVTSQRRARQHCCHHGSRGCDAAERVPTGARCNGRSAW